MVLSQRCGAMCALTALLCASSAEAGIVTIDWENPLGGSFTDGKNWVGASTPSWNNAGRFDLAGETFTVTLPQSYTLMALYFNNGDVTFDLDGNTLYLGNLPLQAGQIPGLIVGENADDDASLTLTNGVVSMHFAEVIIGKAAGAMGSLTLTGDTMQMYLNTTLTVGEAGTGAVRIEEGAHLTSYYSASLGVAAGSEGLVHVTGEGSRWQAANNISIGVNGDGTVTITDGGTVESWDVFVGLNAGGTGSINVAGAGSNWAMRDLLLGEHGTGTLAIVDGGEIAATTGSIGTKATGIGTATVTGSGSSLAVEQKLTIGAAGTGTLNILNGGTVSSQSVYLGNNDGGEGSINVAGSGSSLVADQWLYIGFGGTGTFTVADGGDATTNYAMLGLLNTAVGTATITGSGSTLDVQEWLTVGINGEATLNILDGGVVTSKNGMIAALVGSTGDVNISGQGSRWNIAENLWIGGDSDEGLGGNASLTISNGGLFEVGGDLHVFSTGSLDLTYGYTSNPTNAEKIIVGGQAVIAGDTSIHMLKMDDGLIFTDDELVLIETGSGLDINEEDITLTSGVFNPNFANNVTWTLDIRGNKLVVIASVHDVMVATYAVGGHNLALAKAIDDAIEKGEFDETLRENLMALVQTSRLNGELRTLSPDTHRATTASTLRTSQMINFAFSGEMAARRSGMSGVSQVANATPGQHGTSFSEIADNPALFNYALGAFSMNDAPAGESSGWGGFARGIGVFDRVDSDDERTGYRANVGGFHAGIDRQIHRDWIIGLAGAYAHTDLKFRDRAGDGDIHTLRIGPYVSWTPDQIDGLFVDASASYGYHRHDIDRNITVGNYSATANGEYDAHDLSAYASVGYDISVAKRTTLTPMASVQYTYLHRESFTETGAPGANLDIDSESTDSLQTSLGVKLTHMIDLGSWKLVPEIAAAWGYEHLDRDTSITARFDGTTSPFTISGSNLGRSSALFGVGVSALLTDNLSGFLRYEGEFQSNRKTHAVVAGVGFTF